MMRVMLDSNDLAAIAALDGHAEFLATYSDLLPDPLAWISQHLERSELLLIDRGLGDPSGMASIADVETGALTVAGVPGWVARKRAAKVADPTVYCNRVTLPAVDRALEQAGISAVFRLVATLDGTTYMDEFVGTQDLSQGRLQRSFAASSGTVHADLSLIREDNWHPATGPAARETFGEAFRSASATLAALDRLGRQL